MATRSNSPFSVTPRWILFGAAAMVILGVVFRFSNLEGKLFWRDEAITALRVAGYTGAEFTREMYDGRVRSVAELRRYQNPQSEKTATDVIHSLAIEDPHHPPLYYLMERRWTQFFGTSFFVRRSLSALIGILFIAAMLWLTQELFSNRVVA
ncbi:MAG: hypothetical protein M3Z14_06645, partial [Candidatus Eremiobacteraeota bacterium]|nr:hypothetical protein [Candidatus Eremiobacteraeota bacterium]